MVKVLVLTRSTGEGHNRVAQALQLAFETRGHTCEVLDALWVVGKQRKVRDLPPGKVRHLGADTASQLYGWTALKVPYLFGAAYTAGDIYARTRVPSPIYLRNARWAQATHEFIEEHHFDVVIATHLFPQETLSAVRRRFPSHTRYYAVLTDYSCTPFFAEPRLDGFFIPHPDMGDACLMYGLPLDWTYPTGIPVLNRFRQTLDKAKARAILGIPVDRPVFLVMSGGVGGLYTGRATDKLLADGGERTHVVVLTGRREDQFTAMAGKYRDDPRVSVVPFTDRVPDYMAAADVLVSKPGAVSSTEAAVVGLPLVHTGAIPGGETKNAKFFADRGMSLYSPNPIEAARLAHWLLANPKQCQSMLAQQRHHIFPDGAERVVTQIEDAIL